MAERITGQTDRQTDLVFLLVKILFGMILFFQTGVPYTAKLLM